MLNNFIYAKQKSLFTKALNNGEVLDEAIVFIEDTKEIWNHGTYFDCSTTNFEEILSNYVDKNTAESFALKSELTNYVDKTTDQTISGIKTFTKDININNLIRIRPNIYPGEFKVTRKDDDKGFMIRVDRNSTDNVLPLEILTTDGYGSSYMYQFPKTSGIVQLGVKVKDRTYFPKLEDGILELDPNLFTSSVDITYEKLKELRDSSMLLPGQKYRIIDYITTTNGSEGSSSANHKFDIIVEALTTNQLSENAKVGHAKYLDDEYSYDVTSPYCGHLIAANNWGNVSISNIPEGIKNLPFNATSDSDVKSITITQYAQSNITCNEGPIKVFWQWQEGSKKLNILGVELIDSSNVVVSADYHIGSTGTYNNANVYTVSAPKTGTYKFRFYIDSVTEPLTSSCTIYAYPVRDYFQNTNLSAWEIKYSLDNNTNIHKWAQTNGSGKGVIYYMKDEYCNEATYDFKNIKYDGFYTFSYIINDTVYDGSVKYGRYCNHNSIEADQLTYAYKGLSKVYFKNTSTSAECNNNIIGNNCWDIHFGSGCKNNVIGPECEKLYFGNGCKNNSFIHFCQKITMGDNCINNSFEHNCQSITFGEECTYNKIRSNCYYVTFGNYFSSITLEGYNQYITLIGSKETNVNTYLKNIRITPSVKGQSDNYLNITAITNSQQNIIVTKDSSDNVIQYFEGDFIKQISDINSKVDSHLQSVDQLVNGNVTETIESFNEVITFLDGISDDEKLNTKLQTLEQNQVTESTVQNWGFTKNVGTITGVTVDGITITTSGVANIPNASTSAYGATKLSSSTSSDSTELAATSSAVKEAYDLANSKLSLSGGTLTGDLHAPAFYQTSDATKKDIIGNVILSIQDIANAPSIRFVWKHSEGSVNIGTIAQYWKNILPEVIRGEEGTYSVDYATLATVNSIQLAKKVVEQEETIQNLKIELSQIKQILENLLSK